MRMTVNANNTLITYGLWQGIDAFQRWLMTPTVQTDWAITPRWQRMLKQMGLFLIMATNSLVCYWLGGYESAPTQVSAYTAPAALSSPPVQMPVPQVVAVSISKPPAQDTGTAVAPDNAQNALLPEDAEGLRIDTFRIGAVSGYPNRLRYELALSNKGRKLIGKLRFTVVGEQHGEKREMPLDQPEALAEAKPRVEVSRLLNTHGFLDLPEGYVVHKVVVHVVEGGSLRVAQSAPMWPT